MFSQLVAFIVEQTDLIYLTPPTLTPCPIQVNTNEIANPLIPFFPIVWQLPIWLI